MNVKVIMASLGSFTRTIFLQVKKDQAGPNSSKQKKSQGKENAKINHLFQWISLFLYSFL